MVGAESPAVSSHCCHRLVVNPQRSWVTWRQLTVGSCHKPLCLAPNPFGTGPSDLPGGVVPIDALMCTHTCAEPRHRFDTLLGVYWGLYAGEVPAVLWPPISN